MSTVEVEISLPPRELSPNASNQHWARVAKAKETYKEMARVMTLVARAREHQTSPFKQRAVVHITFLTKGARREGTYAPRDEANGLQALKAAIDGVVLGGLLVDDSHQWLRIGSVTIDRRDGPAVLMRFEEDAPNGTPSSSPSTA